jgi:PAS domain S-box-containing protein
VEKAITAGRENEMKLNQAHHRKPQAVVVNDDVTQLNVYSGLLKKEGLEVQVYDSAKKALEAFIRGEPPDLIVTDLYMPVIDGWRFCRLLRSPEYAAFNQVPILVVSATFSGEETQRITADLGANAFLPAPINAAQFIETVCALLKNETLRYLPRVLIVEDSRTISIILKKAFEAHGYHVETALTGQEAIQKFEDAAYDIAVLDYHLPDIMGDQLLLDFKKRHSAGVFIMITSDPRPELAISWMKQGAAAYARKPFEPDYLVELCEKARRERALLRVEDLLEERTRELREKEERFRTTLENVDDLVYGTDHKGVFTYVSPNVERITGFRQEEIIGRAFTDFVYPEDIQEVERQFSLALDGEVAAIECRFVTKTSETIWVKTRTRLMSANGKGKAFQGVLVDITDHKRAGKLLAARLRLLQYAADHSVEELLQQMLDEMGLLTDSPIGFYHYLNTDQRTIILQAWSTRTIKEFCRAEGKGSHYDLDAAGVWVDCVRERRPVVHNNYSALAHRKGLPEGHPQVIRELVVPIFRNDLIVAILGVGNKPADYTDRDLQVVSQFADLAWDIAERKQADDALRDSEERFRTAFENASVGMAIVSFDGIYQQANQAMALMIGYRPADLIGKPVADFTHPEELGRRSHFISDLIEGKILSGEQERRFLHRNGAAVWTRIWATVQRDHGGKPLHFISLIQDITTAKAAEEDKKKIESQLLQAQKMEAIGALAGGIAHDFNNILSAIIGNTELAMLDEGSDLDYLKESLRAANRAKDLVKQILSFSRQTDEEKMPVHVGMIAKEVAKFLRASIPTTIDIQCRVVGKSGTVQANSVELHQILMNLCTNAVHAIGQQPGVIEIEVQGVEITSSERSRFPDIDSGPYVKLSVRDTGQGIPHEIQERIFDPYFTTKEKGVGTGLGLAVVHGIIQKSGGAIDVESEPGKGSTFHIYLPRADLITPCQAEQPGLPIGGSECILFVDDEKVLVDVGERILKRLGYDVVARTSPIEALELFKAKPNGFDLVITDQTMPGMTGDAFAKELIKINPEIPVILCTGYSQLIDQERAQEKGIKAFVMKPILINEMDAAIRKVLRKE